uniref:Uncharacterized protein n=1 Tax=Rhinolophus ferrumequinum TaxID=59479 RepID=A0A671DIU8_RHIFE
MLHLFGFSVSTFTMTGCFLNTDCPRWVAALGFPVIPQEVFDPVATLLQCPQEAPCPQPLGNGPVHLAVLVASPELFREGGLTQNGQESLGLLVAPVHT